LIPRRIHMRLILSSTSNKAAQSRLSPVVCVFRPESDIHEKVQHFGEFKFDLWQAVRAFWPAVPDVVTASFGFSVDFKKIHPRIQASGLMSHLCEWRIADEKITYNFNPIVLVQAPKGSGLGVGAELRLGLEKSFAAGVYHKAYLKSAKPKVYRLDPKTKILHARSYMAGDEHKLWPVSKEITDEDLAKTLRKEFIFLGDHRLRADDPEAIRPPGTMSSKGVAILLLALVLMFVFAIVIGAVYG